MDSELYKVIFNGNDINSLPFARVNYKDIGNSPERQINIYKIARADRSVVTSAEYSQKPLLIYLDVKGCTRSEAEEYISDLKALLQAPNGTLETLYAGKMVQYTATLNRVSTTWHLYTGEIVLEFIASDPIAKTVAAESLVSFSTTASTFAASLNVDGSFNARPVIVLAFSAGSGAGSVTVENSVTSQGITFTGNFTAGTIVEIDSENYALTVNGVNTDFSGIFPVFAPGSQQIRYSDTLSSRNVTLTATYNVKYA